MASDHSMDIGVKFDFQELRNAVDQAQREARNRYDLKDSNIEIELSDDNIKLTADSKYQVDSIREILINKMVGRGLSSKILDKQEIEEIGGMRAKQELKLIKALDQENAKKISKMIRENFPKAKPVIQGDSVRISSKSIDDLQGIKRMLEADEGIKVPIEFGNFR